MPKKYRIIITAGLGFLGMDRELPGARAELPDRRKKGGDLSGVQKRNARIGKKRIRVEHRIKDLKDHYITKEPYPGSPEEFNQYLNIVTGLANFKKLFPQIKNRSGPYGRLVEGRRKKRRR